MHQVNKDLIEKPSLLIALGLLVIAFLSRFYGISEWHIIGDEYFTATEAYNRYLSFIQPSYYAIVVGLYEVFGYHEWLSRVPALVMGVLSVPVFYLTWSRVLGRNAALFGALIVILSAWHLWFSQYGRYYSTIFFFGTLAYYFFYRAIALDQIRLLVYALLASVAGASFHVTFVFVPASCAVFYLIVLVLKPTEGFSFSTRIAKIYLGICVVGLITALPLLFDVLSKWVSTGQTWGYGPLLIIPQVVKYVQLPIVITAAFGLFLLLFRGSGFGVFLALGIGMPLLFLMLGSTSMAISPSYIFYTLPLIILLSGYCCEIVRSALHGHGVTSYVLIGTILVSLTPEFVSHYTAKKSLHLADAVYVVEENYQVGDKVLSFLPSVNIYKKKDFELLPFISHERDNTVDWAKELEYLLTIKERTWVIITSKRAPLASGLERWLNCHSTLVWRKFAKRMDYEVDGYEVFLVSNKSKMNEGLDICNH